MAECGNCRKKLDMKTDKQLVTECADRSLQDVVAFYCSMDCAKVGVANGNYLVHAERKDH